MDVLSHALWAGASAEALRRAKRFSRGDVAGAVALGAMPDLVALLPVTTWALSSSKPLDSIVAYVSAVPGNEPVMADWARLAEHHIHCSAHSLIVLSLVTLGCWRWLPIMLPALLGWWLHLLLDIPTHSQEYYAVTILYPLTEWSFDGIAWTTPWVLGVNYTALAVAYCILYSKRTRGSAPP